MEDFKIVFYIAVAIAWFVYKNYQKVQQNRPKTILPPEVKPISIVTERQTKENISERIRQVNLAKKSDLRKDFKSGSKNKQVKNEIKRQSASTDSFQKPEVIAATANEKKDSETTETKYFSEEDLFDLKKFDIRTAIIYSEILKRPYI
ncbi:MAG: hypothetical protein ABI855_13530 [Bacteroidota bacterium]